MGLSSTQARMLTLTARQHACEYNAQRIEAEKLQLANESDKVYNEYLARLDTVKLQYKYIDDDGNRLYADATFTALAEQKYLFLVGDKVCNKLGTPGTTDPDTVLGQLKLQKDIDITVEDSYTLLSSLVTEGLVVLMEISPDAEAGYSYKKDGGEWKLYYRNLGDENDELVKDVNGNPVGIPTTDKLGDNSEIYKMFKNTSIATCTNIQEIQDEKELKKAEAQYEADMNRINAKDARYDTELSQLETERNAIKTELETLMNVAKDNVDRTFKIFV